MSWKHHFTCVIRALGSDDIDHLGNDIARATNYHFVANPQAKAFDLIGIMQRGVADGDSRHLNRFKARNRRDGASTSYLKLYIAH